MKKAFTLIEILVALGVILLLAGVSATYLRQAAPGRVLQLATSNLVSDLRYASELAVTTQVNQEVRLNPGAASYRIVALESPERTVKTVTLDRTISIATITLPGNAAQFNTIGAAVASGIVVLQVQNGRTSTVDVRPSGYVQTR